MKNAPNFASCSFVNDGLISITFSKQHQHTFRNDLPVQLSLSLHVYLLYLFLNSGIRNDAKCSVFRGKVLVAVKSAGCELVNGGCSEKTL